MKADFVLCTKALTLFFWVFMPMFFPFSVAAQLDAEFDDAFLDMSLDQLGDIQVTSAAKKAQKLSEIAGSVYVLSNEDIQRSGITNIADALRLVPGVQVAKLDANKWAVSIRGFNDIFSNKILILMDGRSVYSPFFGGAYWDTIDTILADIERIEVVKGPGGTLWGANAVNGIINIITKSASQTQGAHLSVLAGNEETGTLSLRYGGELSEGTHYRVFVKGFEKDAAENGADDWRMGRAGFRVDSQIDQQHRLSVQGNVYSGNSGEHAVAGFGALITPIAEFDSTTDVLGGHFKIDWHYDIDHESAIDVQAYYDRTEREHFYITDYRDTFDLDFQHRFKTFWQQELVWGVGFRYLSDKTEAGTVMSSTRPEREDQIYSAFVQDEVSLIEEKLLLTFGSKFEHNSYTGFEYQPSARLLWKPLQQHSVWGAVSRAVRVPARMEEDMILRRAMFSSTLGLDIRGNAKMDSEELLAYELGYRFISERLSLDLSLFYNDFDQLRTIEVGPTLSVGGVNLLTRETANQLKGEVYGAEISASWQLTDALRLVGSYSYIQMQLHLDATSMDSTEEGDEGDTPHHQANLRSIWDVTDAVQLDSTIRYVSAVDNNARAQKPGVPSYITMDVRLAWQVANAVNLAFVGQNLFGHHREFRGSTVDTQATDVETSLYFLATLDY